MLSLEHFKLLSAKAAKVQRGTGGTPDITLAEVSDVLAGVEHEVALYARFIYGLQRQVWAQLVRYIALTVRDNSDVEAGVVRDVDIQIAELALRCARDDTLLTPGQKAFALGIPWWKKKHEDKFRIAESTIDSYDYEIRHAVNRWNEAADWFDST